VSVDWCFVAKPREHLVIPDCQIKPGVPLEHLDWIAQYVVDKKPDVLVIIGDWADMPSLSSYDVGTKSFEGRTYRGDILAANDALQRFMAPIEAEIARLKRRHMTQWNPRKIVTLGNHEHRINVAVEKDRKLEGIVSTDDIFFKQFGFEVYPFLQPVEVDGVVYCHYFCSGVMGRPITTAKSLLNKMHQSCFAGHQQERDIAYGKRANGSRITGIIAGCCYQHDESYLNPQTNNVWRGVYRLNEVNNGTFDELPISLTYLKGYHERRSRQKEAQKRSGFAVDERRVDLELPQPIS
jgi:hypothetical protein